MTIKSKVFELLESHYSETGELLKPSDIVSEIGANIDYIYSLRSEFKKKIDEIEDITEDEVEFDEFEINEEIVDKINKDFKANTGSISVNSLTINTLEKAIEVCDIDLNIWEIERHVINSWQVTMKGTDGPISRTNYQVKIWLKKKTDYIKYAIQDLIDNIDGIRLNFTVNPDRSKSEFAGEMALYDAHFGKFSWNEETLMGNWDTQICKNAYLEGCEKSLKHIVPYNPQKIFFVFGNDFMHFENTEGVTPKGGHTLDVDGRLPKVARTAMEAVIEAINMCRSVAPVEVKWVPGNHDLHASMWLSLILEAFYRNDKYVTVDNGASHKKAVLWGKLLVGWLHDASGRKMSPSINLVPQFWPELWGQSIYRELHVGHKHKKTETKTMPINTIGGTIIRQIPSLSSIDYWHADNVFVDAVPAGEALLWSKEDGVVAHYTSNIKPVFE